MPVLRPSTRAAASPGALLRMRKRRWLPSKEQPHPERERSEQSKDALRRSDASLTPLWHLAPIGGELFELRHLDIGHGPEIHAVLRPEDDVVALALGGSRRRVGAPGPDEQINEVLVVLIDERCDGPAVEIIETAAGQREVRRGEILDRRRKIELAVEPRLYGVAILGRDILQMARLQGADMTGDNLLGEPRRYRRHDQQERQHGGAGRAKAKARAI